MSFEKADVEQKVLEKENRYQAWILEHRNHVGEIRNQINQWLIVGDEESFERLLDLFHDGDFIIHNREINDIAYMMTAIGIFEQEREDHIAETILHKFKNINLIKEYLIELKFLLWRIEFLATPNAAEEFFSYVSDTRTSVETILYMVHIAGMDKFVLLTNLAGLCLDHGNLIYAFKLLKYANEIKPGEEIILCFMAQICLQSGQKEAAADCLRQILHPSPIAVELGKMCGEYDLLRMHVPPFTNQEGGLAGENKIAFITCVNDDVAYAECKYFIHRLHIPSGYEIEIIPVYGAKSMTSGYNAAMKRTKAKYKVYLHQDLFLLEENFLHYMLHAFLEDAKIGMLGICGTQEVPKNGLFFTSWNRGSFYSSEDIIQENLGKYSYTYPQNLQAVAVDGCCIMTQYDIAWREKEFDGWDFYDVSQSFEFLNAGYQVVIPYQEHIWCLHDSSYAKLNRYEHYKNILFKRYTDRLEEFEEPKEAVFDEKAYEKGVELIKEFDEMFKKDKKAAFELVAKIDPREYQNRQFFHIQAAYHIWKEEQKFGEEKFLVGLNSFLDIAKRYKKLEYQLRRMEYASKEKELNQEQTFDVSSTSLPAIVTILFEKGIQKETVLDKLIQIYESKNMREYAQMIKNIKEANINESK